MSMQMSFLFHFVLIFFDANTSWIGGDREDLYQGKLSVAILLINLFYYRLLIDIVLKIRDNTHVCQQTNNSSSFQNSPSMSRFLETSDIFTNKYKSKIMNQNTFIGNQYVENWCNITHIKIKTSDFFHNQLKTAWYNVDNSKLLISRIQELSKKLHI